MSIIFILGEVQYIVIPNVHHTFWALQFLQEYQNAYLVATYGLKSDEKLNKYIHAYFTGNGLISNPNCLYSTSSFQWPSDEIDYFCFYNVEFLYEVVFYHRLSSTLVLTDLAFNYFESSSKQSIRAEGYLFRFYLWLADGYHQASLTKPFKYFFRKNINLIKDNFDELMLRYKNFECLIMTHGNIIHHGGYEALKFGTYQFVLDLYEEEKHPKIIWCTKTKIGFIVIAGAALLVASRYFTV